jgi:glycosyltransferase involved in cell wall biosynthesis
MRQSYVNFNCYLIDDRSTDNTVQKIQDLICEDERFNLTINDQKMYALGNIVLKLNEVSHDEDVNIILDGDDWLPSKNILSFINKTYSETDCYMTYGSYVYYPTGRKGIEPSRYPDEIVSHNRFREDKWRASHLRTFKGKLFKKIKDSDLRNKNGEYYKTAYDQALMLPLLELSGDRHVFLEKIMHVYNRSNPLNVDKTKQKLQYQTALEIRQKKRYQKIK